MVDCIFSPHFFAYFIFDLLLWRDYDVRDCDTEFRMWLVHRKSSVAVLCEVARRCAW